MMKPTEQLTCEHDNIKTMLNILGRACARLKDGQKPDVKHLQEMVKFIQEYADKYHHAKEEDLLFPAMEKVGILKEGGPIGCMLFEHDEGRSYVKGMIEVIEEFKVERFEHATEFVQNAQSYINLLAQHIEKEDSILYPMAQTNMSEEQQEELSRSFERIETERFDDQTRNAFLDTLEKLKAIYLKN